jgi:hypothetical protein
MKSGYGPGKVCLYCYEYYSKPTVRTGRTVASDYLVFILPRGITAVMGGIGRSEPLFLGSELSFLGFLAIFSLR